MRNTLIITVIFILISFPDNLFSQEILFVFEPGVGSYRMKDLKEINDVKLKSLPFDSELTDDFPMYWIWQYSLLYSFRKYVAAGITGCYQSTGSRISRIDYSGEYSFDTRIRSVSPGIKVEFRYPADKFGISFSNEVGLEFSKLVLREYIKLGTQTSEDKYTFTSKNIYYYPSVSISYPVSFIRLGFFAGYLIDLKKESLSGHDGYLVLSEGNRASSDWSGIRAGLSLSLSISNLFNKNL